MTEQGIARSPAPIASARIVLPTRMGSAEIWLITQWIMAPIVAGAAEHAGERDVPAAGVIRQELLRMSAERVRSE
jgi:hypothetical protein